jgi:SAM-dependent methyltransferase
VSACLQSLGVCRDGRGVQGIQVAGRPHIASASQTSWAPAVDCGWCGTALGRGAERASGRTRCAACGAWTTDPRPASEELVERAYGDWYRPPSGRFAGPGDALLRAMRGHLARRLDDIAPAGRILDVGAGEGALLDALQARGRSAVGLERRATHPGVRELDVAEVDGSWAGIVFWHSLEHLQRAGAALDHAASILVPEGVLVIALPNPDSLQAALFGNRWFALDLPRHLVHVPAPVLLARLARLGLRVDRVSYLRGGQVAFGWLHGVVGLLPCQPDLYDAVRRPEARRDPQSRAARAVALAAGALLLPAAAACAAVEAAMRRGGTVYVEARRV